MARSTIVPVAAATADDLRRHHNLTEDARPGPVTAEATIKVSSASTEYDVKHALGRKPGWVRLHHSINTATPVSHYSVIGVRPAEWTDTNVRVNVLNHIGSMDGGQITVELGGGQ